MRLAYAAGLVNGKVFVYYRSMAKDNRGYLELVRWGGTPSRAARALGISRQRLHNWAVRGVPIDQFIEISRRTGIPRQRLRPDLYEE